MELDPAKNEKARKAKWREKHIDRGDGRCASCMSARAWPCVFAQAANPKSPEPQAGEKP